MRLTASILLTLALVVAPARPSAAEGTPPPPAEERRNPSDDALATAVGQALADDKRVNALKMKVAAEGGIVTLTGDAAAIAEKDAAESVARGVAGVRDVENRLVVTTPGAPEPGTTAIPEVPAPKR